MISSVIPARLEFSCGHAALVSLPRLKGETAAKRTERVNSEKTGARGRACDFCEQREQPLVEVLPVQADTLATGTLNGHHAPSPSASPATPPAQPITPPVQPPAVVELVRPVAPVVAVAPAVVSPRKRNRPLVPQPTARARSVRAAGRPAAPQPAPTDTAAPLTMSKRRATAAARPVEQRYEIRFSVETLVQAATLRAALRLVESLGATDVLSIVRTER